MGKAFFWKYPLAYGLFYVGFPQKQKRRWEFELQVAWEMDPRNSRRVVGTWDTEENQFRVCQWAGYHCEQLRQTDTSVEPTLLLFHPKGKEDGATSATLGWEPLLGHLFPIRPCAWVSLRLTVTPQVLRGESHWHAWKWCDPREVGGVPTMSAMWACLWFDFLQ